MRIIQVFMVTLITVCAVASSSNAQCLLEDDDFATQDGGCKDLSTGLVFGPDVRALGHNNGAGHQQLYCDAWFNDINYGGHNDWRVPTVGEIEVALANGLNSHLDFFLDGNPDDGFYRWTSCSKKVKGSQVYYQIRFTDGDVKLDYGTGGDDDFLICVRGLPSDNNCPSDQNGGGGKGGKGKNNTSAFLQRSMTGGLLLLPLCLVGSSCALRRRSH